MKKRAVKNNRFFVILFVSFLLLVFFFLSLLGYQLFKLPKEVNATVGTLNLLLQRGQFHYLRLLH